MIFTILKPFWHREGSMAEQSRAEPSRPEPSRAGPGRAEPSRAKPSRSEPGRAEPEPSRAEMSPKAVFCHRRAPKSIQKPVPPKPEINQNVPNMPKLLPNGLSHLFLFKTPVFFFTGWGCPKGGSIVRELIGRPHILKFQDFKIQIFKFSFFQFYKIQDFKF